MAVNIAIVPACDAYVFQICSDLDSRLSNERQKEWERHVLCIKTLFRLSCYRTYMKTNSFMLQRRTKVYRKSTTALNAGEPKSVRNILCV